MWLMIGYGAIYPARDSKTNVISRMKKHVERNFAYHGI